MLLMSVALMTAAMLATALLPTYAQIGAAAGWLLFLLRCVMGFSVGGEYTGVVAYLLEGAPTRKRGLIASLASAASEIGALLAVAISALTVAVMDEASLQSWGWRIPFLFGAALAGTVWIARSSNGGIRRSFIGRNLSEACRTALCGTVLKTIARPSAGHLQSPPSDPSPTMSGSPMCPLSSHPPAR